MGLPSPSASGHRTEYDAIIEAPFGAIGLRCTEDRIDEIEYLPPCRARAPRNFLAGEAAAQLRAYLANPSQTFDLPLAARGTTFQRRVWAGIAAIPPGRWRSYGELARELGSAPRAVGQACGANPFPILVPCHRVVAASPGFNGGLGGFAHARDGYLVEVKRWLLRHEGALRG